MLLQQLTDIPQIADASQLLLIDERTSYDGQFAKQVTRTLNLLAAASDKKRGYSYYDDPSFSLLHVVPLQAEYQKMLELWQAALVDVRSSQSTHIVVDVRHLKVSEQQFRHLVVTLLHAAYSFSQFKSKPNSAIHTISLCTLAQHNDSFTYLQAVNTALITCKDLANTPANYMTPSIFAERAATIAATHASISVQTIDESEFAALGMNAFLFVAQGSVQPAKLVLLEYYGAKSDAPYALIGKGVTFDTGGISLKPPAKMDEMKYDMCGAASVLATIQAVAELALPINLVVACALAENMPSGNAGKPGDIITSLSQQTIEVLNTDAEGRLVLCDTMTYVQNHYAPRVMIDVATLTGACVVALGHRFAGMLSNDAVLAEALKVAAEESQDAIWQLPLDDAFREQLHSPFADIANIGNLPAAQTSVAACFLEKFCQGCQWAHLDIAGVAWHGGNKKAATGRPVRLLIDYLIKQAQI